MRFRGGRRRFGLVELGFLCRSLRRCGVRCVLRLGDVRVFSFFFFGGGGGGGWRGENGRGIVRAAARVPVRRTVSFMAAGLSL